MPSTSVSTRPSISAGRYLPRDLRLQLTRKPTPDLHTPSPISALYRSLLTSLDSTTTTPYPVISHILNAAVTRSTWQGRLRTANSVFNNQEALSNPVPSLERFLQMRSAKVSKATMLKDMSWLKWVVPRVLPSDLAGHTSGLLQDLSRGLRHQTAALPKKKALPMSRKMLRRLLPTLPPRLQGLVLIAFRTASRVGEVGTLRWCDLLLDNGTLLIQFRTSKTNQDGERRPDHKILLSDAEPEIIRLLLHKGKPQDRIWSPSALRSLRQLLARFVVPPEEIRYWQQQAPDETIAHRYGFHSLKRGAAALAWEAVASGAIPLDQLMLLLKHKCITSALEYCPNPTTAARAVGSSAAHITSLRGTSSSLRC